MIVTNRLLSSSGRGFGDPLRREPERVVADVERGLVSPDVARSAYGVVIAEGAVDAAETEAARNEIRRERVAAGRPVDGGGERPTLHGGELLHPVADSVEAVRVDGELAIRCSECHTRLSGYDEDYKRGTLVRELALTELNRLNEVAPPSDMVAREFCCPGCGTALALDVQRAGEPLLSECAFGDLNAVPPGGVLQLSERSDT